MKWLPLLCVLVIARGVLGAEDLSNATLVVYNPNSPDNKSLAEYYAARRGIPKDRLVALPCSNDEEIDRYEYDREIAGPLRGHLQEDTPRTSRKQRNKGPPLTKFGSSFSSRASLLRFAPRRITREIIRIARHLSAPRMRRQWTRN